MRQNELRTNQFERFQELLPEDSNSTRDAQGRFEDRKIGRLWDFFTSVEEPLLRRLAGQESRAEYWKDKAAQQAAVPDNQLILPNELNPLLKSVLGIMCFQVGHYAEIYRKAGYDIPCKAEEEQAFFLHRYLIFALQHGEEWLKVANEEIKTLREKAQGDDHA